MPHSEYRPPRRCSRLLWLSALLGVLGTLNGIGHAYPDGITAGFIIAGAVLAGTDEICRAIERRPATSAD